MQYRGFPDIRVFEYPFGAASDSSVEGDFDFGDDDTKPPYSSYHFERHLGQQWEEYEALECRKEVLQWASGVS
jgi:hypothetical protein